MNDIFFELLNIAGATLGFLLVYFSIFFVKEQDKWHSRLELWWSEIEKKGLIEENAFLNFFKLISQKLVKIITVIYGSKLFSFESLFASTFISIGVSYIGEYLICNYIDVGEAPIGIAEIELWQGLIFLIFPFLKIFTSMHENKKTWFKKYFYFFGLMIYILFLISPFIETWKETLVPEWGGYAIDALLYLTGFFVDITAIWIIRKIFNTLNETKEIYKLFFWIFCIFLTTLIFSIAPIYLCNSIVGFKGLDFFSILDSGNQEIFEFSLTDILYRFGFSNFAIAIPLFIYICFIILLLLQKVILFHMERFIYFIKVNEVIKNRLYLFGAGVLLISLKFKWTFELYKFIHDLFL